MNHASQQSERQFVFAPPGAPKNGTYPSPKNSQKPDFIGQTTGVNNP